jgi:hypothetical protein
MPNAVIYGKEKMLRDAMRRVSDLSYNGIEGKAMKVWVHRAAFLHNF